MAPTRRPSKSKYTADRGIPGAFEGETVTRRRFMTGTAHGAGALATMGFALPALAFAVGPIFTNASLPWQTVGTPADFRDTDYTPVVITISPGIGEAGTQRTGQPRWAQRVEIATQRLYWVVAPVSMFGLRARM